jgi:hypothetical protein
MWKWGGIVFGIGILLMVIDWSISSKKQKGGISPTDKKRVLGTIWLVLGATGLVMALIWAAEGIS